jgi:hypothetical protein
MDISSVAFETAAALRPLSGIEHRLAAFVAVEENVFRFRKMEQ